MIIGKTRTNQPVEGGQEFEDAVLSSDTSFENIVDKDGHKRFIEGEINGIETTGITYAFGKWSLSGSHLMIILAGQIANETVLTYPQTLAEFDIPAWIHDKLVTLYGNVILEQQKSLFQPSSGTTQSTTFRLAKLSENKLSIYSGSLTLTADRNFRIDFDLLIDNE